MDLRPGIKLLEEHVGDGPLVERKRTYRVTCRITLNRGDVVRFPGVNTDGEGFFAYDVCFYRDSMMAGIFQAFDGMRVGGYRKVVISPHLAFGAAGIPGVISPNAKLTVEMHATRPHT